MDLHYVQDSEEDSTPKRSSRKKGKTTERIVWSGSPVYTEDEDKFYHAVKIDNINYYLKEHIQLPQSIAEDILKNSKSQSTKRQTRRSSNSSLPSNCVFIGNIKRLWENSDNIKMCEISNIWASPDVTPEGRRPHHGAKELVKFDQLDELTKPLNDLFPKTHSSSLKRVLESFEEFSQRKDFPDEVYLYFLPEKLLEPKIEAASPAKRIRKVHTDSGNENDENETQNETQKEKRDSSSSSSKSNTHSNRTEEPGSNDTFDDLPTSGLPMPSPSPSKRKNMRMISDEDDYIVVKQEESLDENGDRPLRRLKRNRKIFDDEEEEETSTIVEPEDETPKQLSTPKRRRRIIADSDDDEIFTNEPDPEPEPEPTRRSTRIPSLQQQKHEKVRRIVSNKRSTLGEEDNEDESNNNDETQDSSEEFNDKTAEDEKENNSVDLTEDDVTPSKPSPPKTHNNKNNNNNNNSHNKSPPSDNNKTASKRDMSWIEMSEKGKLAAPGAKHSLLFDKPKSTNFDLNKRMKRGKQADIKSFMTEQRGGPEFVHLVDEDDGDDDDAKEKRKSNSASVQNKSKRTESEKKRGSKEKPKSAAFIPQLMFDDNDVDNDMRRHLKQQMLQHDLSRYSNTNEETRETRGRWGHSKRRAPSPTDMDDDSDNADNDSGYESDDFLVADDAPIETYAPSQDELDDGLEESDDGEKDNKEEDDNDEFEDDNLNDRNDQDGLFNHVFTNKQAFIVFLQYIISSCADDDFIPMMVDAEHQDTYFKPALRKIRDQIASRKASLVQSSAWEENFKEDLENRVYYASWEAQNPNLEDCHACLRANHPASFKLCLSGPVYNPEKYMTGNNVLELPVLPDKDREDYEEADEVNYLLGRFCHKRTSLYHRLHFFHVHMYERVKKKVEHQCHVETEELVQSLLDNTSWITEMSDIFTNLLLEADDFMNDSHEIM